MMFALGGFQLNLFPKVNLVVIFVLFFQGEFIRRLFQMGTEIDFFFLGLLQLL